MDRKIALDILGLGPVATRSQAKKAYRQLAKTCHPDRFSGRPGAADAEIRMKRLNEAFAFLEKVLPDTEAPVGPAADAGRVSAGEKSVRSPGGGFFAAFGKGLRAMASAGKKRAAPPRKARVSPAPGKKRSGPARKKRQTSVSFERVLKESVSGKVSPDASRPRPPAYDAYARYVRLKQHLRMQRGRSGESLSRVEKVTPVRPVPRVGDG